MNEAMERERSALLCDPGAAERELAEAVTELARKRERLLDLATDGLIGKDELAGRLSGLEAERASVERELSRVRDSARRLAETRRLKRVLLGAFGTGLKLGLTCMPPSLRREIYQALGIQITVSADGFMRAEARVDEATIRFSQEAERYAAGLKEIDERITEAPLEGPHDRLARVKDPFGVEQSVWVRVDPRTDRIERELAALRRELSSSPVTDTVMAEVAT